MSTREAQLSRSAAVVAAVCLVAAGCRDAGPTPVAGVPSAGAGEEAATTSEREPSTLRAGFVGGLADAQLEALQEQLASASGPVLEFPAGIDVQNTLGAEQEIVRAVADGRLDLGWVGVRALRELGVPDLDPLVAPMLLDSRRAQEAVLDTDLPARMLDGLEPLGVTGLAVLGGPLRRPIAAGKPLLTVADFRDVPFYTWHGEVNALAVEALGAQNVDLSPEERNTAIEDGTVHAFENTVGFLADNADWRTSAMTVNVNLWPSVSVLVANPEALSELPEQQRAALTTSVAAVADRWTSFLPDEQTLLEEACRAGATFAVASTADLEAIEAALAPVHEQLRENETVAAYLDEIEQLTEGMPPETPTVPDTCGEPAGGDTAAPAAPGEVSEIDGTWTITWTAEDLAEALGGDGNPEAEDLARANAGTVRLVLDRGRYDLVHEDGSSCPGTFEVGDGRLVATATDRPDEWECGSDSLGQVAIDAAWSRSGDRLTLSDWELTPVPAMIWFNEAFLGTRPLQRVDEQ